MSDETVIRDFVSEIDLNAVPDHIRDIIARAKILTQEEVKPWRDAVLKCAERLGKSQLLIDREFSSNVSGDDCPLDEFERDLEIERNRVHTPSDTGTNITTSQMIERLNCDMPKGYRSRSLD